MYVCMYHCYYIKIQSHTSMSNIDHELEAYIMLSNTLYVFPQVLVKYIDPKDGCITTVFYTNPMPSLTLRERERKNVVEIGEQEVNPWKDIVYSPKTLDPCNIGCANP